MNRRRFMIGGGTAVLGTLIAHSACAGADYANYAAMLRRPLQRDGGMHELVRYATLAPNGHNTQSWLFAEDGNRIVIRPDLSRRTPVVDPDDHHVFVSLGAALENLSLASFAAGRPGEAEVADDGTAIWTWTNGAGRDDPLLAAIPIRQSTRTVYDSSSVDAQVLAALETQARGDGVRLVLITDRPRINAVRDLVIAGNGRQMDDPAFMTELRHWIRFNAASAMTHGDGLYSAATGSPDLPDFLGPAAFRLFVRTRGENAKYAAQIDSSAGLAVLFGERADPRHWVKVGRAAQRFLLEATRQKLCSAFVNQPVEVEALRPQLAALAGEAGLRPDLVIRFGHGTPMPFSPRRPVSAVLART